MRNVIENPEKSVARGPHMHADMSYKFFRFLAEVKMQNQSEIMLRIHV